MSYSNKISAAAQLVPVSGDLKAVSPEACPSARFTRMSFDGCWSLDERSTTS